MLLPIPAQCHEYFLSRKYRRGTETIIQSLWDWSGSLGLPECRIMQDNDKCLHQREVPVGGLAVGRPCCNKTPMMTLTRSNGTISTINLRQRPDILAGEQMDPIDKDLC